MEEKSTLPLKVSYVSVNIGSDTNQALCPQSIANT